MATVSVLGTSDDRARLFLLGIRFEMGDQCGVGQLSNPILG